MFFEPITDNTEDTALIYKTFEELKTEIELIFKSSIIKNFCSANNIELSAIKEKSKIMEPLSTNNKEKIY